MILLPTRDRNKLLLRLNDEFDIMEKYNIQFAKDRIEKSSIRVL